MTLLITLLPFLASRVLAHSNHAEIQIYDSEVLLALSGYAPICWADPEHLLGAHDIRRNGTEKWDCQNGDCDSSTRHPWTHSTPCFRDSESDQELCVFTDTSFADGRGISLVTTLERANYLASNRAFTEPEVLHGLNQDLLRTAPAKYEVRPVPGKGMGVVATTHILRGELIMANTASYMIDYAVFNGLSPEEYTDLQAHAVDHLPASHRAAILALSSHNTPSTNSSSNLTHTALIDKITATNIFDIDPPPSDPDQHHSLAALFPHIARINHDCRPNAEYRFSHPLLAQLVHAARDIFPGEELTISYLNPLQPLAARQKRLSQNWGFTCSCPACKSSSSTNPSLASESDSRIAQIQHLRNLLQTWDSNSSPNPSWDEIPTPAAAELLITLHTLERLHTTIHEAYILAALAYSAAGDEWTAMKYARMAIEYGTPMVGAEDEDVQEMGRLVGDVRGHWSWMRRRRVSE